jgi:hypothetical protein
MAQGWMRLQRGAADLLVDADVILESTKVNVSNDGQSTYQNLLC